MPYVAAGWLSLSRSALALGVSASLGGSEGAVPVGPHRPGDPPHSYDDAVQVIEDEGSAPTGEISSYPLCTTSLVRHRAGAGEPLVLLHGVGESAAGWHPVQEALSRQYDVIALDLPGFGDSARLPGDTLPNAAALAD